MRGSRPTLEASDSSADLEEDNSRVLKVYGGDHLARHNQNGLRS